MDCDLVIVGAGAAGLAAGLTARAAGCSSRILEAASRVGGRAHTVAIGGTPFDLGCHYLHHATRNPLAALALTRGEAMRLDLQALDSPEWLVMDREHRPEHVRAACEAYYDDAFDVLEHDCPDDVAYSELLDTQSPYYDLFRAWCSAHYGAPPERLSARDAWMLEDLDHDWPVANGYGALIQSLADGLPIELDTPVSAIRRTNDGVEVTTPRGPVRARAVVVTVSTEVLKAEAIRFEPGLPDAVRSALDGVVLGHAERIGLRMDGRVVEPGGPLGAHVVRSGAHAMQLYFHEFGDPMVTGYVAGDLARDLAREGREATLAWAEEALVDVLGADVRRRIQERVTSAWGVDPRILGGYSVARPGRAEDRARLARPFDARVRLAGEACSIEHFGTAHGAWATGAEAVSALLTEGVLVAR